MWILPFSLSTLVCILGYLKKHSLSKKIRASPHPNIYSIISQEPKYFLPETSAKGCTSCFKIFSGLKETKSQTWGRNGSEKTESKNFLDSLAVCFPPSAVERAPFFSRPFIYIFFLQWEEILLDPQLLLVFLMEACLVVGPEPDTETSLQDTSLQTHPLGASHLPQHTKMLQLWTSLQDTSLQSYQVSNQCSADVGNCGLQDTSLQTH